MFNVSAQLPYGEFGLAISDDLINYKRYHGESFAISLPGALAS